MIGCPNKYGKELKCPNKELKCPNKYDKELRCPNKYEVVKVSQ